MLEFQNVTFRYDDEPDNIIENLSFHVGHGEFVSLIGVSGCGKSTIFRLTNRLLTPDSGTILVDGAPLPCSPRRKRASGHAASTSLGSTGTPKQKSAAPLPQVGYMPQKDLLFAWRTVEKNLWLPMELRHLPKDEMRRRTDAVLNEAGLAQYKNKYPKDLSGGMRQRISFARTLLTDAKLMLLDEPFSALDSLTRMAMQEWLLTQWAHFHKTILFITHDVEEALFLSQKIFVVTKRPIRRLEVIDVPAGFPRSRSMLKQPEMIELKESLIDRLRKQVTIG